ncbi:SubName: Full=Related to MTQ2-Putative S-adenosylmethionine-dependent methyltransferase {ECO:0000313/EMBL:CCA68162.1} [Serendipita indica DSM 11827]|nr:SubName: Full=Related to MTQ2-Putative S-adenosylmethionine-dependent methyltransferase {ECO:0000313/EMBL:CCA68162.1} [Serendipita indica DSM 11827]
MAHKGSAHTLEDTFALLDAIEMDLEYIKGRNPRLLLEIGSGSGCVATFAASALGSSSLLYCCTDINQLATSTTKKTGNQNKVLLDPIQTSLASGLNQRCYRAIDVLLFNPPYVPTEEEEVEHGQDTPNIQSSWAGGSMGMHITDILLDQLDSLLSPKGCCYLVTVAQNRPKEIMERVRAKHGLESSVILSRRAGGEHLHILRFSRPE